MLTSDGRVYNWGWNGDGRLGHIITTSRVNTSSGLGSLVRNSNLNGVMGGVALDPPPVTLGPCLSAQPEPAVPMELSTATNVDASSTGLPTTNPTTGRTVVLLGHVPVPRQLACLEGVRVVQVSCGERHGLALSQEGAVWSWGRDSNGQLGRLSAAERPSDRACIASRSRGGHSRGRATGRGLRVPAAAEGRVDGPGLLRSLSHVRVIEVSAGGLHSIAATDLGALYSWGAGRDGKLGHGDVISRAHPARVEALRSVKIAHVSAGDSHSLAISSDGGLFSFGLGECGRLGHGSETSMLVPQKVHSLEGQKVCAIAAGFYHSIVLLDATAARSNAFAAPHKARTSAAFTIAPAEDERDIPVQVEEYLVATFGDGAYGKLGHGDTSDQLIPRIVESLRGMHICEIAAGYQHSAVRTHASYGRHVLTAGIGWKGQLGSADLQSGEAVLGMDPDFYHTCVFQHATERL
mmetsp:Transcript_15666/g.43946  ORF Transcript_15666/g.43946 Transcript_15666/m.43946 type:complete len:464 (-) Transcript_15666:137-1528(-)